MVECVISEVGYFLQPEGEDELKKMQLMELAIMNGTYRDGKAAAVAARKSSFYTCKLHLTCPLMVKIPCFDFTA